MKQYILLFIVFFCICSSSLLAEASLPVYTSSEVAKHASKKDCWLTIDNKVYDVTSYIPRHPAPPESILDYCGKESTEAFHTKNKARPHTAKAIKLLSSYLIGTTIANTKELVVTTSAE